MQQDLFHYANQQQDDRPFNPRQTNYEPGVVSLRFEQILLTLIGLLVLFAFVYSWGFEKGRNAMVESTSHSEVNRVLERKTSYSEALKKLESGAPSTVESGATTATYQKVELPDALEEVKEAAKISSQPKMSKEATLLEKVIQENEKTPEGRFTIQHVTYLKESQAEEELQKLSKMGYKPFVIPSGKYLQICINGFNSKADAVKVLKQLKTDGVVATDAYIRNMPQLA